MPALQNFIDKATVIMASWLNPVDVVVTTVFEQVTTKAAARTALTNDAAFEIANGGTGARTAGAALSSLGAFPASSFTQANIGLTFYPQTAAELAAAITPTTYAALPGQVDRYFTNTTPGTTDATAGFTAAIAQAQQSGGAPVTVNSLLAIASNVTIPYGVPMQVLNGSVNVAVAKTLTINGNFSALRITCFIGAGVVIFGQGSVVDAFPEWWGARADSLPGASGTISVTGTDCTTALQACLYACAGGTGVKVGLVSVRLANGYYLTGNLLFPPATTLRGMGVQTSGFIAKSGTTGVWHTDTGSAAKIILEDYTGFCTYAVCSGMTYGLQLGHNTTQFGTEGSMKNVWYRDCACSGSGFTIDIDSNVGYFDHIAAYANGLAGQSCISIVGVSNFLRNIVPYSPGSGGTGLLMNAPGCTIQGLEIEAPAAGSLPLSLQQNCEINGLVLSGADATALDHWVEFGGSCTSWKITGVGYLFHTLGTSVVTNGNFKRADGSFFGGNATAILAWSASTAYVIGNIVTSGGNTYICILGHTNHVPPNGTYWAAITTPGYSHGGEGSYFSDNGGQIQQGFTFKLVNTAGTLQHNIADANGNALNFAQTINAAATGLTNTPTGTDSSTAFAAGAKISSAATNTIILDTPNWPAGGGAGALGKTQRLGDYLGTTGQVFQDASATVLTCIASVQSFNVNGVTANRWTLGFYDAISGAAFALTTGNIASGKLVQVPVSVYVAK